MVAATKHGPSTEDFSREALAVPESMDVRRDLALTVSVVDLSRWFSYLHRFLYRTYLFR